MLTKLERTILKKANVLHLSDPCVTSERILPLIRVDQGDFLLACNQLDRGGYFEHYSQTLGGKVQFFLSYKGRTYVENRRLEAKSFIIRSIFTPIVVSAITAIITLLLTGKL